MTADVEQTLAEIFDLVLAKRVSAGEEVAREDTPAWDSLKHLEIIFAVESAFEVSFTPDEMAAVRSLGDIRRKLMAADAP